MKTSKSIILSLALPALLLLPRSNAWACDPCALFNATRINESAKGEISLSLSEQVTEYSGGNKNVAQGEFTRVFSSTQLAASYSFTRKLRAQAILPWVVRRFDEVEGFRPKTKTEDGFGDMVLLLGYSPLTIFEVERSLFVDFSTGVKFPTGDSGSLRSVAEISSGELTRGAESLAHHAVGPSTGLGGRVLSIGTGSYDVPFILSVSARLNRLLMLGFAQYTIRTEGDFDYEFADDFLWNTSIGHFLLLHDDYNLALQASLSGEHKGKDLFRGERVPGTSVSNLYLGPSLVASALNRLSAELALDLPVYTDANDFEIEPDYRLRAALSWRF